MLTAEKRILVIEGHPIVAQAIVDHLLECDPLLHITIQGCAKTALEALRSGEPWFRIFMDLGMPGCEGLFLVRQCQTMGNISDCVIISSTGNIQWITEIKKLGALGFIRKDSALLDFKQALVAVLKGQSVFPEFPVGSDTPGVCLLTRRQQDVLCLLHRGYTSKRIAAQLGLSTGTVDNHVMALIRALSASGRTHAVAKAIDLGYLKI